MYVGGAHVSAQTTVQVETGHEKSVCLNSACMCACEERALIMALAYEEVQRFTWRKKAPS
jgi:hypothetical protein